jgi:hypothetical protein
MSALTTPATSPPTTADATFAGRRKPVDNTWNSGTCHRYTARLYGEIVMYWLFLLLAIGAFILAISTTQMWLLVLALVASLVFALLWVKGLYVARMGSVVADTPRALHPAELQALREQLRGQANAPVASSAAPASETEVPAQPRDSSQP